MPKRTRDSGQFLLDFGAEVPANTPARFAGLEAQLCRAAGDILHGDPRRREVIAAETSILLDEEISRAMLDAMASPARDGHRVHMSRFLVLAHVCARQDIVDRVMRPLGLTVLVGDEVKAAQLGNLIEQHAEIGRQIGQLKSELAGRPSIGRGRSNT